MGLALAAYGLFGPPGSALGQTVPSQEFGITAGVVYNSNRGLDTPDQGDTTEVFTRFDFGVTFATPVQSLAVSGDVTLRALDGAEAGDVPDGLADPNLRLRYAREARNARLSVSAFARQSETSTLIQEFDSIAGLTLVNDDATRLNYGLDAEIEMRREAPFGITLLGGGSGLRYSNTASTTLLDQNRYNIGVRLRFDINPVLRANVTTRYSTFEEEGSATGLRETYTLNASLRRNLTNGSVGLNASAVSVEEGERYALSLSRALEGTVWDVAGSLGVTESVNGRTLPSGTLDLGYELPNGALGLDIERSLQSGLSDNEQDFTRIRFNYTQELSALSSLALDIAYRESNPTGAGGTTSLGSIGISYQRNLAPGWRMNVSVSHRDNTDSSGASARDNRVSLSVRRALSARR